MVLDDLPAAGTLMEAVNILRHQRHPGYPTGQRCERIVAGIGLHPGNEFTPPLIPAPYRCRVAQKGLRCRKFMWIEVFPEPTLRFPKSGHATFRRNAGACQYKDMIGPPQ